MGTVFRAFDTKLNRPVAVKFLSEILADATARRRFQREAQLASSLNHPHILTVYDAGDFEWQQYLVTEYIDGGTLRDWANSTRPNWRQSVELRPVSPMDSRLHMPRVFCTGILSQRIF